MRTKGSFYSLVLFTLLLFIFPWSELSTAQNAEGALTGIVEDTSGARIAGARVLLSVPDSPFQRQTVTSSVGEFRLEALPPGDYRVEVSASGFAVSNLKLRVAVSSSPTIIVKLKPQASEQKIDVEGVGKTLASQPIETTSSVQKTTVSRQDLSEIPLAHRSFANIAYLAPMTQPVEPSDPTKARITAVSFAGSSGLNVDLSVDGGDNNDDYIGGFLQNYSPDAMEEFSIRTAQFDADTSRTNGGSVIISTRKGSDAWHGSGDFFYRGRNLNARNPLDNPEPNPKQPFSRENEVFTFGGPLRKSKLWFFSSLEYVRENASVAYSANSLKEFSALSQLAAAGLIAINGISVNSISVPSSVPVPFRDTLFSARIDWAQSARSQWFFRAALDRNHTQNDLIQQSTLPSTGATTTSNYGNFLINNQFQFSPTWLASFTLDAGGFHHVKDRNSHLGLALAFPFSATFHTTSGFETFGDNQFVTSITAFPILRDQQKYHFRYDLSHVSGSHAPKFGVNFIHEPVLSGKLSNDPETLVQFPQDPSFYVAHPVQFSQDLVDNAEQLGCPPSPPRASFCPSGNFSQNIQRLGLYAEDSWRILPKLTINYGLRYDTTFGLFRAEGVNQDHNPAFLTLRSLGIPLVAGTPQDYRGAFAPRLGIAYAPGSSGNTVIRAGIGMYYNDLTQNGWVDAFRSVNAPNTNALLPSDQGFVIDPHYHTPYALQTSLGVEHQFGNDWHINVFFEHHGGVHQYRRYEYASGFTLPATAPNISLFKTDNRSSYNGISFVAQHRLVSNFEVTAHYTFARATTWGAGVGELFDYVNGVTDVRNPFGPGDHGPSGEDVRHRLVLVGTLELPYQFQVSTLSQFESARPFTITTPVDLNNDGITGNDRAVINGVHTSLDQFRGTPYMQVDLRVSRAFDIRDRIHVMPFVEFFNLFNRQNPGNNYVGDISALPVPVNSLSNATAFCLDTACTLTQPIHRINDVRFPAGALGDFFGPGTSVGIPFAAQLGIRVTF